jgi:ferredoxin
MIMPQVLQIDNALVLRPHLLLLRSRAELSRGGKFIDNELCMIYNKKVVMQFKVTIEKCTGCGTCFDVCPTDAIKIANGKAEITMECIDCGACPRVCPEGAIKRQTASAPVSTVP